MVVSVIGLTGGIASGKSTVAAIFRELGAPVIDADQLARQVVVAGSPALEEIRQSFGDSVLDHAGNLDRGALGKLVFADDDARKRLNAITHPKIAAASQREIAAHAAAGKPIVIYEAALIVENGLHKGMNALIVVSLSPELQLQRLMKRDNLTREAARQRMASQMPLDDKLSAADYLIDNGGTQESTRRQTIDVWEQLKGRFT